MSLETLRKAIETYDSYMREHPHASDSAIPYAEDIISQARSCLREGDALDEAAAEVLRFYGYDAYEEDRDGDGINEMIKIRTKTGTVSFRR